MAEKRLIDFLTDESVGQKTQENFEKLRVFLNGGLFTGSNFRIIEREIKNPSTNYLIGHGLSFKPKDCFVTNISNGTATINHSKTTDETISLNVSDASSIRIIVGSFS